MGKNCKNFQWQVCKKGSRSRNLVYLTEKSRKGFKFIVSRSGVPIETRVSFVDPKTGVDCTLNSIKPKWRSDLDQYTLDLDGLAEVASIRNFIINNDKGQEAYLSGKLSDKTLQIRFSHPFSPVQAFAIALATL